MTEQPSPREIVADHAEESIVRAASFAAEAARIVCHVRLGSVPTIYAVTAEFYTAAYAMQTAAENMIGDLTRMAADADLYDARPDGDPQTALEEAKGALARAASRAGQLGRALQDAQNAIAGVGHRETAS
jgi:hypothetical protein